MTKIIKEMNAYKSKTKLVVEEITFTTGIKKYELCVKFSNGNSERLKMYKTLNGALKGFELNKKDFNEQYEELDAWELDL